METIVDDTIPLFGISYGVLYIAKMYSYFEEMRLYCIFCMFSMKYTCISIGSMVKYPLL